MAGKAAPPRPAPLTVSKLGKAFSLSRSTLLYYDRIGLLRPSGRTGAGYRLYGAESLDRLTKIAELRTAGMPLETVKRVLAANTPLAEALERQLISLNGQLARLRAQQRVVMSLLKSPAVETRARAMSKVSWTKMFRAIGMTDEDMRGWHANFEQSMPDAHQDFLESLGLDAGEVARIRAWAASAGQAAAAKPPRKRARATASRTRASPIR
jgi:MerR family transcriptional regulator, thiopeptide resistance regulator